MQNESAPAAHARTAVADSRHGAFDGLGGVVRPKAIVAGTKGRHRGVHAEPAPLGGAHDAFRPEAR